MMNIIKLITRHYVKLAKQNQEKISKIHKKKYLPVLIR